MPGRASRGTRYVVVEVEWELAGDGRFNTATVRGRQIAHPEPGHAVHVEVAGLAPRPRRST